MSTMLGLLRSGAIDPDQLAGLNLRDPPRSGFPDGEPLRTDAIASADSAIGGNLTSPPVIASSRKAASRTRCGATCDRCASFRPRGQGCFRPEGQRGSLITASSSPSWPSGASSRPASTSSMRRRARTACRGRHGDHGPAVRPERRGRLRAAHAGTTQWCSNRGDGAVGAGELPVAPPARRGRRAGRGNSLGARGRKQPQGSPAPPPRH